jgi:hypothetical protein
VCRATPKVRTGRIEVKDKIVVLGTRWKWVVSFTNRLSSGGKVFGTYWIGGKVGHTATLTTVAKIDLEKTLIHFLKVSTFMWHWVSVHADLQRPSRGYDGFRKMTVRDKILSEVCNIPSKRHVFIENLVTIMSSDRVGKFLSSGLRCPRSKAS